MGISLSIFFDCESSIRKLSAPVRTPETPCFTSRFGCLNPTDCAPPELAMSDRQRKPAPPSCLRSPHRRLTTSLEAVEPTKEARRFYSISLKEDREARLWVPARLVLGKAGRFDYVLAPSCAICAQRDIVRPSAGPEEPVILKIPHRRERCSPQCRCRP